MKRRPRTAAAALFLHCLLIPVVASAVTYTFTPLPFSWIDPSAHTVISANSTPIAFRSLAGCGTVVPVTDDTISDPISLGFNFQFASAVVDSVRIMSNGRLQFLNQNPANGPVFDDTSCGFGTPDQFPFPSAAVPYTMKLYGADIDPTNIEEAAPYATRCSLTGAGSGTFGDLPCFVSFATTGSAPNLQFVVTWNNVPEWTNGNTPQGNFQLQTIVRQNGTFVYQYGTNFSVSVAEVGWQADPAVGDFDVPNIGPLPPQSSAFEFYVAGPTSVMTTGGTPQSAVVNTAFAVALQATVKDLVGNPVVGVTVNFAAPGSGPSATLSAPTAVTDGSGLASVTATANATAGSYSVTASVAGVATPTMFSLANIAGAPATMTADAGTTPQSATINTAFANALAVTVLDAGSNPVSGVNVTFTAPGSAASGLFSNSTTIVTVATDAVGMAAAPFNANGTAGGPYMATAASPGLTTVNFSLTNIAGAASSMTANAGTTPQSATINTAFANALAVTVLDAGSNPVSGANVTFTAPGSGASGVFSNTTTTITVATNASGVAAAPFTANGTAGGPYTVTAGVSGLTTVNFSLINTAGAPATMTANAGTTPQSATAGTAFANALAVTVKDGLNNPVAGVNVTFTAPGSGASGVFSNTTTTITVATNASGVAAAPFTANGTAGGPYTVTAGASGLTTVNFSLTNTAGAPATMTANAGTTPQSTTVNTTFVNTLAVTVRDASNNPVAGINVTFTAPGSVASGLFSNSTTTITVATNVSGVAAAPFTANAIAGGPFMVAAATTGLPIVNFSLTNTAGAATSMTANAGTTPQSTTTSTAFANVLAVTVKDVFNNPAPGVSVTFTAPSSGASGLFSNSTTTITVATNASGVASAPFTANATAGGPYTVTAAATGLTSVNFSLTNTAGSATTMTANAGTTPQSAKVNTTFANALAVTVKDASNNSVSGVNVTFTAPGSSASGVFSNSTATITVATNVSGVASAPFTANATAGGPYTVTAAASGLTTANFSLTNTAGAPVSMTAGAGTTPQSATISTAFASALAVTVKDAGSNPVAGVNVTFTAPGSGASGVFSNSTTTIVVATNASGVATAPFTANATAGGTYTVTAAASGLPAVNFTLGNTTGAAASVTPNAGATPQSSIVNAAFVNALAVTVRDAGGNPVAGVIVNFSAPGSGAGATLSPPGAVSTDGNGVASVTATANSVVGSYSVTATAAGLTPVTFSLSNVSALATIVPTLSGGALSTLVLLMLMLGSSASRKKRRRGASSQS